MAIELDSLPVQIADAVRAMSLPADPELTPRRIVALLDAHIVGQQAAKRAVAVALRNRLRRQRLDGPLQKDITPRNILLIGPTGVGKTELGRRLADLAGAPFLKIEATSFSEVGYVGRNVSSMITDLMEVGLRLARQQVEAEAQLEIASAVTDKLVDLLHPWPKPKGKWEDEGRPEIIPADESLFGEALVPTDDTPEQRFPADARAREQLRRDLLDGRLETREVTVITRDKGDIPRWPEIATLSPEDLAERMRVTKRRRRLPVAEAREVLAEQARTRLCDQETINRRALSLVEQHGIIFLDEIDKIAEPERGANQSRISREGVQRDLLPLIEGTTVQTKHGPVCTDHILFIAAGAFHLARVEALIPELQGRFPVRVQLDSLGAAEFVRILTEPQSALTRQHQALLAADGVTIAFTDEGLAAIAERAVALNKTQQDIGARRLQQLMEKLLEDVAFDAPESGKVQVTIDAVYVLEHLGAISTERGIDSYIL